MVVAVVALVALGAMRALWVSRRAARPARSPLGAGPPVDLDGSERRLAARRSDR